MSIDANAWKDGRWRVLWSEMPATPARRGPGGVAGPDPELDLAWSRRHPVRCLWCGVELQSNVLKIRREFIETHSHSEFPELPDSVRRQAMKIVTVRERVALDLIDDNPWQPRQQITQESVEDMADDIRRLGRLLQTPLARRASGGRFQLAFGHRRIAGCRYLRDVGEWEDYVDLDIDVLTDEQMALIALSENVARRQLTGLEIAKAWKKAIDDTDLTVNTLAEKVGVSHSHMSNHLRVLELPAAVLEHVESGALSVSVAREFLVLQHASHTHLEDMERIVRSITSVWGSDGLPDWTRRHVRECIHERVRVNDGDWRPLGPVPEITRSTDERREPSFDVDAFKRDFPDSLHTIPAISKVEQVNFRDKVHCDNSRVWTCEVKEWSRRQSRGTREANLAAKAAGEAPAKESTGKTVSDSGDEVAKLMADDPVWKEIVAARQEQGNPGSPLPGTAEDWKELGTRAKLVEISPWEASNPFWKRLEKASKSSSPSEWEHNNGALLPPYFADRKGCMTCTTGASYASFRNYRRDPPVLACFNARCFQRKAKAGADEYREKLEAHKKGLFREDRETAQRLERGLGAIGGGALRALAVTLLAQTGELELQHPFGEFVPEWSYENGAASRVREILNLPVKRGMRGAHFLDGDRFQALEGVADAGLRELVANLMTHHLRQAGKLAVVSQETADAADAEPSG